MTNEELLQIIGKAARDRVTELELPYKGLAALPPEIGQEKNGKIPAAVRKFVL